MDQSIKRSPAEDDECYEGIESVNTPYPVAQKTAESNEVEREQLYLASANEIDKKKLELESLPQHLEYAYLHGDKSFPIIV
ncbi:hypothetical protein Tco_0372175, partial [Tanacetum coccineum]